MIKRTLFLCILAVAAAFAANAQHWLVYETFTVGGGDTSRTNVAVNENMVVISSADQEEANHIPGIAKHIIYIFYP